MSEILGDMSDAPVGVFDSGVGGLTVVREIMRQIPGEEIVYFGDTARVPYGSKSKETVIKYTRQIIRFLKSKKVKAIVTACNTASALALETVREELDIPIVGVVRPGAKTAVETTKNKKIGIIGTEATVNSRIYTKVIQEIDGEMNVRSQACPLFVPLIEEGMMKDPVTDEMARRYLTDLVESGIDTLILGCTHYPLVRSTVRKIIGEYITLVNPAYETAVELKRLLEKESLKSVKQTEQKVYSFYVSDSTAKFKQFADSILAYDTETTKLINIEEY